MSRRITNLPEVSVQVNGRSAKLSLASVIRGRLQDGIFARDLAGVEAAHEIGSVAARADGSFVISEQAWRRLAASVEKPATAGYTPGIASQLLPFLRAIMNAEEVPGDGE